MQHIIQSSLKVLKEIAMTSEEYIKDAGQEKLKTKIIAAKAPDQTELKNVLSKTTESDWRSMGMKQDIDDTLFAVTQEYALRKSEVKIYKHKDSYLYFGTKTKMLPTMRATQQVEGKFELFILKDSTLDKLGY